MEDYQHWLLVIASQSVVLLFPIVGGSRWERRIRRRRIVGRDDEVNGEGAGEGGVFGVEDVSFVVDGDVVAADGGPEGLQVAVEEEGVEGAGGSGGLGEGEEGCRGRVWGRG